MVELKRPVDTILRGLIVRPAGPWSSFSESRCEKMISLLQKGNWKNRNEASQSFWKLKLLFWDWCAKKLLAWMCLQERTWWSSWFGSAWLSWTQPVQDIHLHRTVLHARGVSYSPSRKSRLSLKYGSGIWRAWRYKEGKTECGLWFRFDRWNVPPDCVMLWKSDSVMWILGLNGYQQDSANSSGSSMLNFGFE